jgi:2-aminoadipate transaminase
MQVLIDWDQQYAQRTRRMSSSAIRELLKLTELPDVISFAGGLPAPEVFPIEPISAITQRILHDAGPQALQYSATEGYRPLREWLAQAASQEGLPVTVDNILITSGSQQGLDLLGKVLIDPDDTLLVESPTYMGALQAWAPYGAEYVTLPSDDDGLILDDLEAVLQKRPKFIYMLPNFQNPSGRTLSLERRQYLVEATARYGIPIVEDDAYVRLRFEGESLPSLQLLAGRARQESEYKGHVIHMGTFSKILSPGLRLGWIIAPAQLISKLVQAKQGTDLHTPTFTQMIAYEMARQGFIEEHIPLIRHVYRTRRDAMLAALSEYFPAHVTWTHPQGGMFLWATLPEGMDSVKILEEAVEQKVAFVPGTAFHPRGGGENTMRLNFSNSSPEKIREGIARLGKVLEGKLVKR